MEIVCGTVFDLTQDLCTEPTASSTTSQWIEKKWVEVQVDTGKLWLRASQDSSTQVTELTLANATVLRTGDDIDCHGYFGIDLYIEIKDGGYNAFRFGAPTLAQQDTWLRVLLAAAGHDADDASLSGTEAESDVYSIGSIHTVVSSNSREDEFGVNEDDVQVLMPLLFPNYASSQQMEKIEAYLYDLQREEYLELLVMAEFFQVGDFLGLHLEM